jgi:hypothetical protein
MNRKHAYGTIGLLVMSATAIWLMTRSAPLPANKVSAPPVLTPALPPQATNAPQPQPDPGVEETVASDLQRITRLLRDFRTIAGDNPIGSNAEIMQALSGDNPKQAKILPSDMPLSSSGELVDRWGTPYFFHQLSRNSMEVRSAGADRRMWTNDDIFTR